MPSGCAPDCDGRIAMSLVSPPEACSPLLRHGSAKTATALMPEPLRARPIPHHLPQQDDGGDGWTYERLLELDRSIVTRGGMRPEAVKALPTIVFDEGGEEEASAAAAAEASAPAEKAGRGRELRDCSICLEKLQKGDELIALPCSHHFHSECLRPWLRTSRRAQGTLTGRFFLAALLCSRFRCCGLARACGGCAPAAQF